MLEEFLTEYVIIVCQAYHMRNCFVMYNSVQSQTQAHVKKNL